MTPPIDTDLEEFLKRTLMDGIQLVAIREGFDLVASYFGDDAASAAIWARQWNNPALQRGVYYSPNRVRPGLSKKAAKPDIVGIRFAHVDIDPPKDGTSWDREAAIERLQRATPAPSIVISSGAGLQALWRLEEGASAAQVELINKGLIDGFGGDPGTWNVDRILRLPGTVNWPTKKKKALGREPVWAAIVLEDDGSIHRIEELAAAFPSNGLAAPSGNRPIISIAAQGDNALLTADHLGLSSGDLLRQLIENPKSNDRSDDTLKLAGFMVRAGYDNETIAGVLLNPENGISAHCFDQKDPARAAERAISKARADESQASIAIPGPVPKGTSEATPPQLPAPFRGFMAEAVELALETAPKRQPEIAKLAILASMAATCSGQVHLPDGLRPNLFALCVAPTASGKDHLIRVASKIARTGGAKVLGDMASGAGIEDELASDQPMLTVQDEIAHTLAARHDRGNPHLRGVEQMFLRLFSASQGAYPTRSLAGRKSRIIENPCLNLLGFAVPTKLGDALSEGDAISGLLNRMLIALGDGDVMLQLDVCGAFQLSDQLSSKLNAVQARARLGAIIEINPDARSEISRLASDLNAQERCYPLESPERCLLGRTLEKAKRIAGVLAFFDDPGNAVMTMEHLQWAFAFARASDAAMLYFIRKHMHGGKVQADAARVKRLAASILSGDIRPTRPSEIAAVKAGHVPTSLLLNRLRLPRRELEEAVDHLVACGDMLRATFTHKPRAGAPGSIKTVCFPAEE